MIFDIAIIVSVFIVIKALTMGSDFSIVDYIKDGKMYMAWYSNRETYSEYKRTNKKSDSLS